MIDKLYVHTDPRQGIEALVHALRTGEAAAAAFFGRHCGDDVRFVTAFGKHFAGRAAVVERLTGQWPMTSGLGRGHWTIVEEQPDRFVAFGDFAHVGAAPADYSLTVGFAGSGLIATIEERMARKPAVPGSAMSPAVRRRIDRALADGNAMSVAFCDGNGQPSLSLRGSIRTHSDRELSLWARNAVGGLVAAVKAGRAVAMLYRDAASRTTMTIEAIGRVVDDAAERDWLFAMMPEVEQTHDLERQGAALLFTVRSIKGMAPEGFLDIRPE